WKSCDSKIRYRVFVYRPKRVTGCRLAMNGRPSLKAHDSIRLLLVLDHILVRAGFRLLIESRQGFSVIGEADNYDDALTIAEREKPNIILFDPTIGGNDGLTVIPGLLSISRESRVLVLASNSSADFDRKAVMYGAMGLIHKDSAPELLMKAI